MIQLSREKILFSLNTSTSLKKNDPRAEPLAFDLVNGYICPHCDVVVQALYKTDTRMRELTQEYFNLEKPMSPSKFAIATLNHEVMPKYKSYLIAAGGQKAELLREESHFSLNTTVIAGQCKARRIVFYPGCADLGTYLFGLAKVVASTEWYQMVASDWDKLQAGLTGPNRQENAEQMFEELKKRILVATDITGKGADLWLLSKNDWGYLSLKGAVDKLVVGKEK